MSAKVMAKFLGESKTFNVPVQVGHTTVGLKKVVVTVPGLGISVDEGYVFLQRVNSDEYSPIEYLSSYSNGVNTYPEDPLKTTDLHHTLQYYKLAGEAADAAYNIQDETIDDIIRDRFGPWITGHFVYDESFISLELTASDTYLINHRDSNGYFHGVCDEYATMFVSLARALNIPTRQIYVYGWNYKHRIWIGHEFPEIWNGQRWVYVEIVETFLYDPDIMTDFQINLGYANITFVTIIYDALDTISSTDGPSTDGLLDGAPELWTSTGPIKLNTWDMLGINYNGTNNYLF